ncbi:hypothetical protein NE237_018388 [Protea cynaroides]|uniref:PLAT domain-containing protein n=1 Tax=Protea cynaroides TaxID=273540 RepID=A0A9Q0QP46_9MAGN|nr:hypothetical protein NE237_018388 [Protea cynaroides]
MGMSVKDHHLFFFFALVLSSAIVAQCDDCVYTVLVKTGSNIKGGTDSIISLNLSSADGDSLEISNLVSWGGLGGPGRDYFERGNVDLFRGKAKCLKTPVCAMKLTSDGSGRHHGWFCKYVDVASDRAHQHFTVEQWLAKDAPPFELQAIRNNCSHGLKNHRKLQQQQIPSDFTII